MLSFNDENGRTRKLQARSIKASYAHSLRCEIMLSSF